MPQEPQENVDLEAILQTGINTNEKLDEVAVNTEGQLSQQMETNKKLEEVTDAVDVQTEILHKGMSGMTSSMEAMGKAMTFAAALMEKLEGPAGKTPVKGEDYFTEEDINEIVDKVVAKLKNDTTNVV